MKKVKTIIIEFEDGEQVPLGIIDGYTISMISKNILEKNRRDPFVTIDFYSVLYKITGIIIHPEYCNISEISNTITNFGDR